MARSAVVEVEVARFSCQKIVMALDFSHGSEDPRARHGEEDPAQLRDVGGALYGTVRGAAARAGSLPGRDRCGCEHRGSSRPGGPAPSPGTPRPLDGALARPRRRSSRGHACASARVRGAGRDGRDSRRRRGRELDGLVRAADDIRVGGKGGGCAYATAEVIAIVLGFVLFTIAGIVLLIVSC